MRCALVNARVGSAVMLGCIRLRAANAGFAGELLLGGSFHGRLGRRMYAAVVSAMAAMARFMIVAAHYVYKIDGSNEEQCQYKNKPEGRTQRGS